MIAPEWTCLDGRDDHRNILRYGVALPTLGEISGQTRRMVFRVGGVHHVAIVVNDLDEARSFYCDGLELGEIERPNFESEGFWLQLGSQQLHVSQGDDPAPKRNHFALSVEGLDDAVAHLEAKGIPVRRGRDIAGAGRQAFLRDPWGNLVELNEQQ